MTPLFGRFSTSDRGGGSVPGPKRGGVATGLVISVLVIAVAGLPSSAFASTASSSYGDRTRVVAAAGEKNDIRAYREGDHGYPVVEDLVGITAGQGCLQDGFPTTLVLCYGGSQVSIFVSTRDLGDRVDLADGVDGIDAFNFYSAEIRGGLGADVLIGSWEDALIVGGRGRDVLHGGPGTDVLRGNRGADRLNAVDGMPDAEIRCGRGFDRATIDAGLDPKPVGCERVRRV